MNVLVTGATGFIGSHLVDRLLETGAHVRALVRPAADASRLNGLGVEVVRGDVSRVNDVERAVAGRELVYHLAKAPSGSPWSILERVNVTGAANVVRSAARAGVARVVHCSSTAVYGHCPGAALLVSEHTMEEPDTPYAWSKALGEKAAQSHIGRVSLVIARITSVLGPRCFRWLSVFRSVASRRFRLIGRGDGRHHLADVSDVVGGLLLCANSPAADGRTYIIAGNEAITLRNLVQLITEELNVCGPSARALPSVPFRGYLRLNQVAWEVAGTSLPRAGSIAFLLSDRVLDISRARQELGFEPRVDLRGTIQRTAGWYRTEGYLP